MTTAYHQPGAERPGAGWTFAEGASTTGMCGWITLDATTAHTLPSRWMCPRIPACTRNKRRFGDGV